jgi:hypothetical protein
MTDTDALRAELTSLRRQVRILALGLVGALVLAGLSWTRGRRPERENPQLEPGVLLGQSLFLGGLETPYVRLRYLQAGGGLILADSEGRGRVHLIAGATGGRLALGSAPPRVVLESAERTYLVVRDEQGRDRIALRGGTAPRLVLYDEEGQVRLELSASKEGGKVSLYDAGRERGLWAQQGEGVLLRLRDARGKALFQAPAGGP